MDESNVMTASCPDCAAQMPETAAFCPSCGRAMQPEPRAQGTVGGLPETIAGAIAYLTFIPGIVFLLREPFKQNRFVRFHSIQCILLSIAVVAVWAALRLASLILLLIPMIGPLLVVLAYATLGFAAGVIWLVLVVKALQGEMFKLPVLGEFAEKNHIN